MDTSINSTDKITSRQLFVDFLNDLRVDYATNKNNWENVDLESFLEAMSTYAQDIDGFYKNTNQDINADNPSWKTFADILMGARVYE
jgi:hypothetical protein